MEIGLIIDGIKILRVSYLVSWTSHSVRQIGAMEHYPTFEYDMDVSSLIDLVHFHFAYELGCFQSQRCQEKQLMLTNLVIRRGNDELTRAILNNLHCPT